MPVDVYSSKQKTTDCEENVTCRPGKNERPQVVLERDGFVVLYKPPHWTMTTSAAMPRKTSIQAWLCESLGKRYPFLREDPLQAGLVQRLDVETSGCIVIATHRKSFNQLWQLRGKGCFYREYRVLVHGQLPLDSCYGTLNYSLDIDRPTTMVCERYGLPSITRYQAIGAFFRRKHGSHTRYTLVRARILTGRTHQIRVHMRELAHELHFPVCGVVGDYRYLRRGQVEEDWEVCPRVFLHARVLKFPFPGQPDSYCRVECDWPSDLAQVLDELTVDADMTTKYLDMPDFLQTDFTELPTRLVMLAKKKRSWTRGLRPPRRDDESDDSFPGEELERLPSRSRSPPRWCPSPSPSCYTSRSNSQRTHLSGSRSSSPEVYFLTPMPSDSIAHDSSPQIEKQGFDPSQVKDFIEEPDVHTAEDAIAAEVDAFIRSAALHHDNITAVLDEPTQPDESVAPCDDEYSKRSDEHIEVLREEDHKPRRIRTKKKVKKQIRQRAAVTTLEIFSRRYAAEETLSKIEMLNELCTNSRSKRKPVEQVSAALCDNGHTLVEFFTDRPGFACNRCKQKFASGTAMYGCRACDFDKCGECYTKVDELDVLPSLLRAQAKNCSDASKVCRLEPDLQQEISQLFDMNSPNKCSAKRLKPFDTADSEKLVESSSLRSKESELTELGRQVDQTVPDSKLPELGRQVDQKASDIKEKEMTESGCKVDQKASDAVSPISNRRQTDTKCQPQANEKEQSLREEEQKTRDFTCFEWKLQKHPTLQSQVSSPWIGRKTQARGESDSDIEHFLHEDLDVSELMDEDDFARKDIVKAEAQMREKIPAAEVSSSVKNVSSSLPADSQKQIEERGEQPAELNGFVPPSSPCSPSGNSVKAASAVKHPGKAGNEVSADSCVRAGRARKEHGSKLDMPRCEEEKKSQDSIKREEREQDGKTKLEEEERRREEERTREEKGKQIPCEIEGSREQQRQREGTKGREERKLEQEDSERKEEEELTRRETERTQQQEKQHEKNQESEEKRRRRAEKEKRECEEKEERWRDKEKKIREEEKQRQEEEMQKKERRRRDEREREEKHRRREQKEKKDREAGDEHLREIEKRHEQERREEEWKLDEKRRREKNKQEEHGREEETKREQEKCRDEMREKADKHCRREQKEKKKECESKEERQREREKRRDQGRREEERKLDDAKQELEKGRMEEQQRQKGKNVQEQERSRLEEKERDEKRRRREQKEKKERQSEDERQRREEERTPEEKKRQDEEKQRREEERAEEQERRREEQRKNEKAQQRREENEKNKREAEEERLREQSRRLQQERCDKERKHEEKERQEARRREADKRQEEEKIREQEMLRKEKQLGREERDKKAFSEKEDRLREEETKCEKEKHEEEGKLEEKIREEERKRPEALNSLESEERNLEPAESAISDAALVESRGGWVQIISEEWGIPYFWNEETRESCWEPPAEWEALQDETM